MVCGSWIKAANAVQYGKQFPTKPVHSSMAWARGALREAREEKPVSKHFAWVGICGLLILSACGRSDHAGNVGAADNWSTHGGDTNETNYSRLDAINATNVGRLALAWSLDLPGEDALEATPLAIDGVLYFTGARASVYAVEAASGKLLWTYDPEVWKHNPAKMRLNFAVNRGAAFADGRVFAASIDGRLFALDAKTGQLLWSVETVPADSPQYLTGAPRAFNGKVIIGQSGADFGERGYVTAYDAATGKQAWRFYVAPGSPDENRGDPAMERAAATWTGEFWKKGIGGGGPWDSIVFDAELNRIYIGTANAAPYDPAQRSPGGGDNLYTASIVALDADTGKYVWHYQTTPGDSWDYDSTEQIQLATLPIDGVQHKVLMQAPKNGFFYVIDRTTGKLLSAGKYGKVTWADHIDLATGRPVEAPNIRYQQGDVIIWPSPSGDHSWQAMSFDPKTGLVYIPTMQAGVRLTKDHPQPGDVSLGGVYTGLVQADPADGKGALVAYDPVHQKEAWRAPLDWYWNGGALSTAGDLVFQGNGGGYLVAYNAARGERVWQFYAGLGIMAAPVSYAVGGKQYVSVLVGYGGSAASGGLLMRVGWKSTMARRLLTFTLDGRAPPLATEQPDMTLHPADNPALKIDPAQVAAGEPLYRACMVCHGMNLESGGMAPDLRESQIALDPDAFWNVVHEGALIQNGMPRYDELSNEQALQIWAYIRAEARKAATAGK